MTVTAEVHGEFGDRHIRPMSVHDALARSSESMANRDSAAGRLRAPFNAGLQTAVVGVLIYVGVMSLAVKMLQEWVGVMTHSAELPAFRASMLLAYGGAEQVRWSFGVVGVILVLYLWVAWRSRRQRAGWLVTLQYLGASVLVLLLQWALVVSLRGVPKYVLLQLYPQ